MLKSESLLFNWWISKVLTSITIFTRGYRSKGPSWVPIISPKQDTAIFVLEGSWHSFRAKPALPHVILLNYFNNVDLRDLRYAEIAPSGQNCGGLKNKHCIVSWERSKHELEPLYSVTSDTLTHTPFENVRNFQGNSINWHKANIQYVIVLFLEWVQR